VAQNRGQKELSLAVMALSLIAAGAPLGCVCSTETGARVAVRRSGVPPDYTHNHQGTPLAGPGTPYVGFESDVHLDEIGFRFTSPPFLQDLAGDFTDFRFPSNATYSQSAKAGDFIEAGDVISFDIFFTSSSNSGPPTFQKMDAQLKPGAYLDVTLDCATPACEGYSGPGGSSIFEPLFFVPNDLPPYSYSSINMSIGAPAPRARASPLAP
jgi:hypothetical protein